MTRRGPAALALLAFACSRQAEAPARPAPAPPGPVQQGRVLFEQGQLDAALARLQEAPSDPDALYYQGAVWAKKAETAPLPTPPPAPAPLPRGAEPPPPPEFKTEELQALELFGKAMAARPDHAAAHLALADLLAPHAARLHERIEGAKKKPARRGRPEAPPTPEPGAPDHTPERVVREYQLVLRYDPAGKEAAERFVRFCLRVGRLDDAETALKALIQRDRENADPLVRYGDFLVTEKKDPHEAIIQYKQALLWRPDDDGTRGKIADIYIGMGMEHFANREYSLAESRFLEADKYVTDRTSPRALKIQDHLARLRSIRPPTR